MSRRLQSTYPRFMSLRPSLFVAPLGAVLLVCSPGCSSASPPAGDETPDSQVGPATPPAPAQPGGDAVAQRDLAAGTVHLLYIGELGPPDHTDPKTGLPLSSMGCEYDDEVGAYVDAYNAAVQDWLKSNDPFPADMEVIWQVTGPGLDETLTITRRGATWSVPGAPTVWPEERLRVGLLAQRIMGIQVPASEATSEARQTISVRTGGRTWNATWEPDAPIVDPVLVAALEEIRARR